MSHYRMVIQRVDDDTQPEPEADYIISSWVELPAALGLD